MRKVAGFIVGILIIAAYSMLQTHLGSFLPIAKWDDYFVSFIAGLSAGLISRQWGTFLGFAIGMSVAVYVSVILCLVANQASQGAMPVPLEGFKVFFPVALFRIAATTLGGFTGHKLLVKP
jgi:hypothetical protein